MLQTVSQLGSRMWIELGAAAPRQARVPLRSRLLAETAVRLAPLLLCAAVPGALTSSPAQANPKGGQVVAGSATIASPSSTQLTVTQTTNRAAIDWQSFNIAQGERTSFVQPSAAAWTLNRVNAADPSVIAGRLNSNGSLVLINPNGILFSKGSQVDVHSLIATPSDISNANFMAGRMKFDIPPRNPAATVVNNGTITVAQRGLAALVAPGVANSGLIEAKLGKVVLAGAETFAVDFYGDGLISFDIGSQVKTVPIGPDGKPMTSIVSNTGRINAPGGTVLLTADAVAGLLENVVDLPGTITARSVGQTAGSMTIDAGPTGSANLAGRIDVSGLKPGQVGGTATVTGNTVNLTRTARIKARGDAGGGTVRIGGGPHGRDPTVRNAQTATVAAGALIDASATGNGDGGKVTVWSDQTTQFAGTIRARGGLNGGDGGWVETSGHQLGVASEARVDALAPHGNVGNWVLDPLSITVQNGGTGTLAQAANASDTSTALVVDPSPINSAGATVSLQASDFVTFNSPVTIAASGVGLNVSAGGAVNVNAQITTNDGPFSVQGFNGAATSGPFTILGGAINTGRAPININSSSIQLFFNSIACGGSFGCDLNTTGDVTLLATTGNAVEDFGIVNASNLTVSAPKGSVLFDGPVTNGVGSLAGSAAGSFQFLNCCTFTVAGVSTTAGDIRLQTVPLVPPGSPADITIAQNVVAGKNNVALVASGNLIESGGSVTAAGLIVNAGAAVIFGGANSVGTLAGTAGTSFQFVNGGSLTVGSVPLVVDVGPQSGITSTNGITISANGAMNIDALVNGRAVNLSSAAGIAEIGGGSITAMDLVARTQNDPGAGITLTSTANAVTGNVTLSALNAAGNMPAKGTINFVDSTGFTVAAASGGGLNGREIGVNTAADIMLQTGASSALTVNGSVNSAGIIDLMAGTGGISINGPIATSLPFTPSTGTVGVRLFSRGPITEAASGSISAQALEVLTQSDANAGIMLTSPLNAASNRVVLTALNSAGTLAPGNISFISFTDSTGFNITTVVGGGQGGFETGVNTSGNVTLSANGPITEVAAPGVRTAAQNLVVRTQLDGGAPITLTNVGNVVPGNVTLSALNAAGTAPAAGPISFVDSTGFTIAAQPGRGLNGLEIGVNTTATTTLQAGSALQETGAIEAQNLVARTQLDQGAGITLTNPGNAVPGNVTLSTLNTAGTAPAAGAISFVDGTGFTVAAQPGNGVGGQEIGVNTTSSAMLIAGGPLLESGSISATALTGSSVGGATLTNANHLTDLGRFTNTGAAGFALTNAAPLTVNGTVTTGSGGITLTTGASPLTVSSPLLSTGTISLTADMMSLGAQIGGSGAATGQATQVNLAPFTAGQAITLGAGAATGLALTDTELNEIRSTDVAIGSATAGALTFNGAFNVSAAFGTDTAANGFSLITGSTATVSSSAFTLQGGFAINAGTTIALNTSITTPGAQSYTDTVLDLNGASYKTTKGAFTETGATMLTSAVTVDTSAGNQNIVFQTSGTIDGGFGLTLKSGSGAVTIGGAVGGMAPLASLTASGGTITLDGNVTTAGAQSYTDTVLDLTGASYKTLNGAFTETGATMLTSGVTVDTSAGNQNITFQTPGTIDGGQTLALRAGSGTIAIGGAVGGTTALMSLAASGGTIALDGNVTTTGPQTLTQTGAGATLTLAQTLITPQTVTLTSAGKIDQTGGVIQAGTLTGSSSGTTTLAQPGNMVTNLGSFSTGSGDFALTDGQGLNIAGPVNVGSGVVTLQAGGALRQTGAIAALNLVARTQLDSGAAITLTNSGNAVPGNVTLSALNSSGTGPAPGAIDFLDSTGFTVAAQPVNGLNLQEIGINTTTNVTLQAGGNFLTTAGGASKLAVSGSINSGGGLIGLAAGMGGIVISGSIASTPSSLGLALFSTGPISENATGSIFVPNVVALTENNAGAPIMLTGAGNRVDAVSLSTLNGPSNPAGPAPAPGNISFADSKDFQIFNVVTTGGFDLVAAQVLGINPSSNTFLSLAAQLSGINTSGDASLSAVSSGPASIVTSLGASISAANLVVRTQSDLGQEINLTNPQNAVPGNVTLSALNTAGTAPASGAIDFVDSTGFTVAAQPQNGLNRQEIGINTTSDVSLATRNSGSSLILGGNVSAPNQTVTLTSPGTITENSGMITAAGLFADAGGAVNLDTVENAVGVLAGKAGTGSFRFLNGNPLTIGAVGPQSGVIAGQDLVIQTDSTALGTAGFGALNVTANMSAGGNLLVTSHGSLTVNGNVDLAVGKNIVLDANGPFVQQSGVLTVSADPPALVVDTTDTAGTGAQALLTTLLSSPSNGGSDTITTPNVVNALPPSTLGPPSNPISFADLEAGGSVVVLIGNSGAMSGTINVGQLGISGAGASSQLMGSIGGNSTPSAAQLAVLAGGGNGQYLFNSCPIGGAGCAPLSLGASSPSVGASTNSLGVLTNSLDILAARAEVIESILSAASQQSQTQVDILLARPREFDRFTGRPQDEDIDASIINIFDEERLCEELRLKSPEAAREVCR